MWLRILIAGLVGGIIVFVMGALNHAVIGLQTRTFSNLPEEGRVAEALKSQNLQPGIYALPGVPKTKSDEEAYIARYKAGPSGILVMAPTGEEPMSMHQLGAEFATGTVAALIAAWIVSLASSEVGFVRRLLAVLAMGMFAWVSLIASYAIWYRFPHNFVHDELFCAVLEWGVAGLAIAAIVRRPKADQALNTKH